MKRILGILVLLVAVYLATWLFSDLVTGRSSFMTLNNQENLLRRISRYAILGIGVAFVIIVGGIDLSIGSVVCLVAVTFPWLAVHLGWPLWVVMSIILILPVLIGLAHGLLITKLNLQPFIVTLCGLLIYRGVSRGMTNDQSAGFEGKFQGLRDFANGEIPIYDKFGIPFSLVLMLAIAGLASVFLNKTIYGRYLFALGNNEEAARFSGIDTDRMKIIAYVICSSLAGLGGIIFVLDNASAQPASFGNAYELYAIAAAVLGGCSLRGGSGTISGVLIGTGLLLLLNNMILLVDKIPLIFFDIPIRQNIELAIIGTVILAGVIGDEVAWRLAAKRQAALAAAND